MIDIHSHILPGLDDGAQSLNESLELARAAAAAGTRRMVATPHVDSTYGFDLSPIRPLTGELNAALAREQIPLAVLPGAEVALPRLGDFDAHALRDLCLGRAGHLLVETPYAGAVPSLEEALFAVQVHGITPVLAHPERSSALQGDLARVRALVERGVLLSLDAGSMAGRFGSRASATALAFLAEGLVHNVASDAHDVGGRPPDLLGGFEAAERELPGIAAQASWYTHDAPAAMLAADRLPPRPETPRRAGSRLRRLFSRS
jgi:protein-tyrosine phosphatase